MERETHSRTVRFKTKEAQLIDEFLAHNPVFDFSTLTRVAVLNFIKSPTLEIRPVSESQERRQRATVAMKG